MPSFGKPVTPFLLFDVYLYVVSSFVNLAHQLLTWLKCFPFCAGFSALCQSHALRLRGFCLALCDSLIGTSLHERSRVPRLSAVRLLELYGVESFNTATGAISTIVHLQRLKNSVTAQMYIYRQNKTYCCQHLY